MGITDKTWPYIKSDLDHDTLARFEKIKYRNGILSGMGVLSDGTLQAGAFVVDGHHWVEDLDISGAFNFSSLLNQGSQSTNVLYAQYTYTATDPHANAVYGFAASLPSDAVKLGTIVVPASTSAITQGMINTTDSNRDLSNKYLAEAALPVSDPRVPTQDENDALEGMSAPSAANKFATAADLAAGGADNLGNHTATQDINFNTFKGINCTDPVNDQDVATKKYVTDNIPTQNLALSISALRKHTLELELLIEGMTNSPYPDNFGQPFFRTEFDNIGSYVNIAGQSVFQTDHDLQKLTAEIIPLKRAERGRIDTRLQLPEQKYFGEIVTFVNLPAVSDKPHAITYAADTQKLYMITYGTQADDTVLYCINPFTMQIEQSWFIDESSFTRWNGIASGITFGAGQIYIIEYDPVNTGAVCIRFSVKLLPPKGVKLTKSNVSAIESANSADAAAAEVFMDIAYDNQANHLWALKKIAASDHKLTRLKADFTENGVLAYGGIDITTSNIDTSINGIDFDGDFLWFTGDTWSGRMDTAANVNAKFVRYGKTGICRVVDTNVPSIDGHLFNTDEVDNTLRKIAVQDTFSLPATATYKPIHTVAIISVVDNVAKTVTVNNLAGSSPTFGINEYKGFYMRVGNAYYKILSNTSSVITLNTLADISGITGIAELGIIRRQVVTSVTDTGIKVGSYEGGTDNVTVSSAGFMLARNTEINGIRIELGTITTPADLTLRIETDLNGAPSGTLANANATTTIASASLVADNWNTATFAVMFMLSGDTIYHVVINTSAVAGIKGHTSSNNKFNIQAGTLNYRLYNSAKLATNGISDVAIDNKKLYIGYQSASGVQIYQPDAAQAIDTYIANDTPVNNFASDTLIRLGSWGGSTDTWTIIPPNSPPPARTHHSAVIYNGKIYVFGGINSAGSVLNTMWEYNIAGDTWTQKTNGPAIYSITNSVVEYNGKIYFIGGQLEDWIVNRTAEVWEYNIAGDTWTQKTPFHMATSYNAAIVYNGKIYVFGGVNPAGSPINEMWEYNIADDTWTQKMSGPTARFGSASVEHNGKMYVFGGSIADERNNEMWEYNIAGDTWTQKMSGATPRRYSAAVKHANKMYIIGGYTVSYASLDDIWEYDIDNNTWLQKANVIGTKFGGTGAITYNQKIYVFGGDVAVHADQSYQTHNNLLEYGIDNTGITRGLLKFDLTSLPSVAVEARLGVYVSSATPTQKIIAIYKLTQDFIENESKWNAYQDAVVVGTNTGPFTFVAASNNKLDLAINGGVQQTVTFTAGSRTTTQVIDEINAVFPGIASDETNKIKLAAATTVDIKASSTALTLLGLTAAVTSTAWLTAGGDYNATLLDSVSIVDNVGFIEFDITSLYNAWKAATENNNGVLLKLNNETIAEDFVYLVSSDGLIENQRPKLTISVASVRENVGVLVRNKLIDVEYGGLGVQAMQAMDNRVFVALFDKIKILDIADNTELQIINNTTFPRITSTIVKDMAVKELVVDEFSQRIDLFLIVACDNGVSVINMDTGSSYPVMNYELESNTATCKKVQITDNGYLAIVTENNSGISQIDIFGDITKIVSSYTNKSWKTQTGVHKTLRGASASGLLPYDIVNEISVVTKVEHLLGYNTSLVLIANGTSLVEYDVTKGTIMRIDDVIDMECGDVTYWQGYIYAIFSGNGNNELRQYDSFSKQLIAKTGNNTRFNSLLAFELTQNFSKLLIKEDKVMCTTNAGLEIIDVALQDTTVFGDAVWYSELLQDSNGIARATVLVRGITLPREMIRFSAAGNKGAASIAVDFGRLGTLVSKGDTLILYSTSATSKGFGEKILVSSNYDEISATIPFAATTLAENINASSTLIKLSNQATVDAMPLRGTIKIDAEEIAYDNKSGDSVVVASRGVNGTTAASHNTGATVQTVLKHDYIVGDIIVFYVNRKNVDKLIDVRVTESTDGVSFNEGNQVLIEDMDSGYYAEAARSDWSYGQLKIGLKRTDYEEDSVKIDAAAMYWENY